jgi:hypothetical protein
MDQPRALIRADVKLKSWLKNRFRPHLQSELKLPFQSQAGFS